MSRSYSQKAISESPVGIEPMTFQPVGMLYHYSAMGDLCGERGQLVNERFKL